MFLLKILCSLWLGGKCLSIRHRKLPAMFVLTFLLNGGLNQMILRCLFLRVCCGDITQWFGNIKEKHRHSFISFDIVDFYSSISENLLDQALSWASNLAIITKDEISIIKHARKSVLFNDGKPWTKKDSNSLFDVTMGSYDGAEICELVGLFILNKLGQKFGKENIGLYRDDGLAIMKRKSTRLADKTRKELHKCFEQFGLKITAEANLHAVNFLDVTFDLNNGKFKP